MTERDVLVVGGGPAGLMAGYLFARAGLSVTVLEKHGDFLRDFRGDTVHPSTIDLMAELGLIDRFLALPHTRIDDFGMTIGGRRFRVADFGRLPAPGRFIAMMPQWDFLDFLAGEAAALPGFTLRMSTAATGLVEEQGRVAGVRTAGGGVLRARLVIAADGRGSILRSVAQLPLHDLGAPIDVFWFRLPRPAGGEPTSAIMAHGELIVTIDRGDYFQCARIVAKGAADAVRAAGIAAFRAAVARTAPALAGSVDAIASFDEVTLLSVSLDRLTRWHRPGLLAIGDAAHAMSPVGGVGVNLAIQDAVAAANILAAPMRAGDDPDPLLAKVQARRELPVKLVQGLQRTIHRRVIGRALGQGIERAPVALRLLDRSPRLQAIPARLLGLGIRREHVRSPAVSGSGVRPAP